ncbi:TetR/AcrR family transcriptional regulator [Edaphosphingomonas haloaromaticamans]|nr:MULTISPECIES: TetR/AcrR family transcriptional regulator [Sphingomonas]MDX3884350.1 helix-turn-helix domain-containing protein [Sphingomonas sp.]
MASEIMDAGITRGRGRPRDTQKDATIRDAAWRVLADKGYEGLTFEAIAELAGCSRATLYRRFASKDELITAILHETSRAIEPGFAAGESPRNILIGHASAAADYLSGERGQAILKLGFTIAHLPDLAAAIGRHADQERTFYIREFRRLAPAAALADIEFACHTLIGSVTYHVAILRRPLPPARIAQLVDQAIALVADRTGSR